MCTKERTTRIWFKREKLTSMYIVRTLLPKGSRKKRYFFSGQSTKAFSPPPPPPRRLVVKRTGTKNSIKKSYFFPWWTTYYPLPLPLSGVHNFFICGFPKWWLFCDKADYIPLELDRFRNRQLDILFTTNTL